MVDKDTNQPEDSQEIEISERVKASQSNDDRYAVRNKENSLIRKIVFSIIFIVFLLMLIIGVVGYNYITTALEPMNTEETDTVEVEIPMGTSTSGIADILEEKGIVKDGTVFNYYMKTKNVSEFQAGFYQVAPAMDLDEIIEVLELGGTATPISEDYKILVREGATIEEIAEEFAAKTEYSEQDFLQTINDEAFIASMIEKYPNVITDSVNNEDIIYNLEGYLFPATYDYMSHYEPEDMIEVMIEKSNEILKKYNKKIQESDYSLHEILTIASLVEKEGVDYEDRQMIADVIYNRLDEGMPIQSDVSILYALGKHLEYVSIKDTEVESPYNLYTNKGFGPGPFNSPSEEAIQATLNPIDTTYLYFLADLETGEVYFSETFEQHLEYQELYIKEPNEE
ncbi:endolytic transglycosylase MltG [Jeotgalibaca sp. A122]|uniref:endolytic transglycosylase MltG n=1 Tax=Jeotgalibaca sp. A122 TaxID=3457322 RepID=UPI003FD19864